MTAAAAHATPIPALETMDGLALKLVWGGSLKTQNTREGNRYTHMDDGYNMQLLKKGGYLSEGIATPASSLTVCVSGQPNGFSQQSISFLSFTT